MAGDAGTIRPLEAVVFPMDKAQAALRHLAASKHTGKVVVEATSQVNTDRKDVSRCLWMVSGGLGALGLAAARWLVGQTVSRLALLGRTGRLSSVEVSSPY